MLLLQLGTTGRSKGDASHGQRMATVTASFPLGWERRRPSSPHPAALPHPRAGRRPSPRPSRRRHRPPPSPLDAARGRLILGAPAARRGARFTDPPSSSASPPVRAAWSSAAQDRHRVTASAACVVSAARGAHALSRDLLRLQEETGTPSRTLRMHRPELNLAPLSRPSVHRPGGDAVPGSRSAS